MASPQKENGYTPISNELLDAILRTNFIATHLKLILCCCRYTYGFSRKEAELSEAYICKAIGVGKRYVSQELKTLIDMKVLIVVKESTYTSSRILELNKNYEEWGSRTTVLQSNYNSTVELEQDTTVEPQTNTTVEPQCYQDKQDIKQDIKQGTSNKRIMIKPTLEEVNAYCIERNNFISAEKFINYYESNGWMVGRNKMKDWKATIRTWEFNNKTAKPSLFQPQIADKPKQEQSKYQTVNYESRSD